MTDSMKGTATVFSVMSSGQLAGKAAVISGGSRGIGYAIAETFADAGADLHLIAREKPGLEKARERLLEREIPVELIVADLGTSDGIDHVVETVTDRTSTVDVLVNVAGTTHFAPIAETPMTAFDELVDLNLRAPFRLIKGLLPLVENGGGSIINISSYWAEKTVPNRPSSVYSMTQGGLNTFTEALAGEFGDKDIRVNAIAPGAVRTDGFKNVLEDMDAEERREYEAYIQREYPVGRIGDPKEVANAALFFASDESEWITGEIMNVDGGLTVR